MNRYITLCNSEKYLKGALVMYESLNATGTSVPLVVFCPKKTPAKVIEILKNYAKISADNTCKLEILQSEEDIVLPKEIAENNKWLRWNGTFDKLLIFGLSQYEKLVFIDSDMLVTKNLDHLFEHRHMTACFDGHYDKNNLNSGLMVVEPTEDTSETARIMRHISSVIHNPQFGDQDIIRLAFPRWKECEELHLSEQYNLFFENVAQKKTERGYDLTDDAKTAIYIVHFIGYDKPWYTGKAFKWKIYQWVWKTKMCLCGRKKYKNNVAKKVLRQYHRFLNTTTRKLKRVGIEIYEMG